jgi:hypothetical protein
VKHRLREVREEAATRVKKAFQSAGKSPWLVAYDANGIQEFIAANSRPIAMRGASTLLGLFDGAQREDRRCVYAGGGRGLLLADSPVEAETLARAVERDFRHQTCGGVLATSVVPLDLKDEGGSLTLLRLKLELAKDAALPPGGELPQGRTDACDDCRSYRRHAASPRPNSTGEQVCRRCLAVVTCGQSLSERRWSLVDLSDDPRVAVVSADGNNLGSLFASLSTLNACAQVSDLVAEVFTQAQQKAAEPCAGKLVSVASGGDDVRVFLPPRHALDYVETLTRQVEEGLEIAAGLLTQVLTPPQKTQLQAAGVGIGLLVADATFPASRLIALAHTLEDQAKRRCRTSPTGQAARSAVDLEVMTAGALRLEAHDGRPEDDGRPFSLASSSWNRQLQAARALARVESSQRAWLAEMHRLEPTEALNHFRYQVARSRGWQLYFETIGVDWREKRLLDQQLPSPGLLSLVRLLEAPPCKN